jgi:hypothetical protein
MAGQLRVDEITDEAGTGSPSFPNGASIQGLTVGRGAGAVSTNTAVGASALAANTTGGNSVAFGYEALTANTTASNNTAVGYQAGFSATTSARNVFIGKTAGYNTTTGGFNTFVGEEAGFLNTTGTYNTIVGPQGAGEAMTTGSKNTIIGKFNGNQGGLDIRTTNNHIVLSDGDGNPRETFTGDGRRVYQQSSGGRGAFEGWVDWANVSSITFDLAALFPSADIVNQGLNIILQIVTHANSSSTSDYYVMAGRNIDGGNWQFTTMASQVRGGATVTFTGGSGGANNITLTFSVGSQFGKCMIRGVTNG